MAGDLDEVSWRILPLYPSQNDSSLYYKAKFELEAYIINFYSSKSGFLLSNTKKPPNNHLCFVALEACSTEQMSTKLKAYNPNISAPLPSIVTHLKKCLMEPESTASKITLVPSDTGELKVKLKSKMGADGAESINFMWEFVASGCPESICSQLVLPAEATMCILARRVETLEKLIQLKDREIFDYKSQGATVSRKHLLTSPYDSANRPVVNMEDEGVLACLRDPTRACFDLTSPAASGRTVSEFYTAVAQARAALLQKDVEAMRTKDEKDQSPQDQSNTGKHPSSSSKRPAGSGDGDPGGTLSEEEELERRAEINKILSRPKKSLSPKKRRPLL